MLGTILWVVLILWLLGAVLPINNGTAYFNPGVPNLGYIILVLLIVFIVARYLIPELRTY